MKNICFCNTSEFWGGGEKMNLEYALLFQSKGYHVHVVSHQNSLLNKEALKNNIQTEHLKVGDISFINLFKIRNFATYLKTNNIDTLILSTSEDVKFGAIAGNLAKVKRIVYLRELAVRIKGSFINKKIFKNYVTHIIANSHETKKLAVENFKDQDIIDKVKVVYHGIDLNLFDNLRVNTNFNYQNKYGEIIIGNAGRLTKQKGQIHLIEVAKILKDRGVKFKLVIAGAGELEDELKAQIKSADLSSEIILLGFVKDIPGFMHSIDIFALSSMWEGFGFVIAEAMSAFKPVVAFNITSNPEVVSKDKTGFLVEYPDIDAFAEKLILLCEDQSLRKQMGNAGRKSVENRFQISVVHRQLEDLLNSN